MQVIFKRFLQVWYSLHHTNFLIPLVLFMAYQLQYLYCLFHRKAVSQKQIYFHLPLRLCSFFFAFTQC